MTNSLYPAWMRKPNEESFAENLEKQGFEESRERKEKEIFFWKNHLKNRKAWCWKCRQQGLDGSKHPICDFCHWIVCPSCSACRPECQDTQLGKRVRWTDTYSD